MLTTVCVAEADKAEKPVSDFDLIADFRGRDDIDAYCI